MVLVHPCAATVDCCIVLAVFAHVSCVLDTSFSTSPIFFSPEASSSVGLGIRCIMEELVRHCCLGEDPCMLLLQPELQWSASLFHVFFL